METAILVIGAVNAVLLLVILLKLFLGGKVSINTDTGVSSVKDGLNASQRELREEMAGNVRSSVKSMGDDLTALQKTIGENQAERLAQTNQQLAQLQGDLNGRLEDIRRIVDERLQTVLEERMTALGKLLGDAQRQTGEAQSHLLEAADKKLLDSLSAMSRSITEQQAQSAKAVQDTLTILEKRFQTLESSNNERLDAVRRTVSEHLERLSETNQKKLDGIQAMVSDKLESRLRESFRVVSERLEQVHKGLGEMQTVAAGVGDLKKVLSNVKTRGILGEIQLGMILDEILAPEQYEREIATVPGSSNHVEYAVRLPGADGSSTVYLPIDSKLPGDTYAHLQEAYESGNPEQIEEAKKHLEAVVKKCAADIRCKYVEPPYTTNFGVMFLPFEGLYAEVVNSGLVGELQRDFSITVAGPSTMAAMLNSLQMGFRTLAIQKQSNEVWKILGEAKSEFEKFETALRSTQDKIKKAGDELEKLVGTRTRAINRRLRSVESLDYSAASPLPDAGEDT